jgi:hypothetical protein
VIDPAEGDVIALLAGADHPQYGAGDDDSALGLAYFYWIATNAPERHPQNLE